MRRAASARGWKLAIVHEHGYRIQRWTGATDGISWVAESAVFSGGSKHQQRRHVGRWHGAYSPGISSPVVAMGLPKGKEELGKSIADGDGFFARLAQKAAGIAFDKARDVYFGHEAGKEVDATIMHRVDAKIPGYVVMAIDKSEGARGRGADARFQVRTRWRLNGRTEVLPYGLMTVTLRSSMR